MTCNMLPQLTSNLGIPRPLLAQRTSRWAACLGVWACLASISGCTLLGVESEDLDFLSGTESGMSTESSGNSNSESGGSESGDGAGDGDGDAATGDDTDSDTSTGTGTDPTGDGDGDESGSSSDTATGTDSDTSGESETGDPSDDCSDLVTGALVDGPNAVDILDGPSLFEADCEAPGPELAFSYTASVDGEHQFAPSEFDTDVVVTLLGPTCSLEDFLSCTPSPDAGTAQLLMGETIYVIVESTTAATSGTLTVSVN